MWTAVPFYPLQGCTRLLLDCWPQRAKQTHQGTRRPLCLCGSPAVSAWPHVDPALTTATVCAPPSCGRWAWSNLDAPPMRRCSDSHTSSAGWQEWEQPGNVNAGASVACKCMDALICTLLANIKLAHPDSQFAEATRCQASHYAILRFCSACQLRTHNPPSSSCSAPPHPACPSQTPPR